MSDAGSIARRYVELVGAHDLAPLDELFDDSLVALLSGDRFTKAQWIAALDHLLPALTRNDIRDVFAEGDRSCVVYDFVTNTDAGAVRCVEVVEVQDGKITEIELVLDRVAFAPVQVALSR
jgi:ketosteroid isomerase-like protein